MVYNLGHGALFLEVVEHDLEVEADHEVGHGQVRLGSALTTTTTSHRGLMTAVRDHQSFVIVIVDLQ